jgi:hypothetical protein
MRILVAPHEIEILDRCWTIPAVAKCDCGHILDLEDDTNICKCGKAYNKAGDMVLESKDTSTKSRNIGKER